MEAATALAELRETHLQALNEASSTNEFMAISNTVQDRADVEQPAPPCILNVNRSKFPMKMHELLADRKVHDAITWLPHGRSFVILRADILATRVLPFYFKPEGSQTSSSKTQKVVRYTSFTRKLNRWGFRQISHGPDSGAFYHELFRRDDPDACRDMVCAKSRKIKESETKSVSSSSTSLSADSGVRRMESAAVTVSTSGAQSRRALPIKKRRGFGASSSGIPSNVEMKANNTSLLATRSPAYSNESSWSLDACTMSKDLHFSTTVDNSKATFQTAKEILTHNYKQVNEAHDKSNVALPTLSNIHAASTPSPNQVDITTKQALVHNFHEQYRALALASLFNNSRLAMVANGMNVDTSSVSSDALPRSLELPCKEEYFMRTITADSIATPEQHCEVATAAKNALYEAYLKVVSS